LTTANRISTSGGSFVLNHPEIAVPARQLKPDREVTVQTRTLDSFNFDRVDLNKLDIPGG